MAERRVTPLDRLLARWKPIAGGLLVFAVLNAAAHVFVIRRTGAVSGSRELILASARERVAGVRKETDELERTASKLACAEGEVRRIYDEMLSSKQERMTSIQREVRALAKERGLDPDRIEYEAADVKNTGLVRFSISFPIEGQYSTLEGFVDAVEASPNFLIVDEITINEGQGGTLRLVVNLSTYFQAPDAESVARAFARAGRS